MNTRKGFFFSVVIFLLLGYIVLSISAWTASVQITEQRFGERFAFKNARSILDRMDEGEVQRIVGIVMYNSLYELNSHTYEHPVRADGTDEFEYINATARALLMEGRADGSYFADGEELIMASDSLATWHDQLNSSLQETGYRTTEFALEQFSINQSTASAVEYHVRLRLRAESRDGRTQLEKTYQAEGNIPIAGWVDPAALREGREIRGDSDETLDIEKQFFFYSGYTVPADVQPQAIATGTAGHGWFYGKLVGANDAAALDENERPHYAVVGTYDEIAELRRQGLAFGAYILSNAVETEASSGCPGMLDETNTLNPIYHDPDEECSPAIRQDGLGFVAEPMAVIPGFSMGSVPVPHAPDAEHGSVPAILMVAQSDLEDVLDEPGLKNNEVHLFNMENVRDFTLCGYYTQNTRAPSYFQRLLPDSYHRSSPLGMESMVIGSFIGGESADEPLPAPQYIEDDRSRLDRELFEGEDGTLVRGMPGCKSREMCSQPSLIGHFRLGDEGIEDYLPADEVHCEDGRAPCE